MQKWEHCELKGNSVVVMSRGRIVDEIHRDDLDEHRIISAIVGHASATEEEQ